MGLRAQLLLVSLILLLLPWGGCQYAREVEQVLRDNQARALTEQANLLGRTLNQSVPLPQPTKESPFYTPLRFQPVVMDGFDDDWSNHAEELLISKTTPLSARLKKGLYGNDLYLFLQVHDMEREYHRPDRSFRLADHVRISTRNNDASLTWLFFASEPGRLQVFQQQDAADDSPADLQEAPEVEAWWHESRAGYQLEIRIPQALLLNTIDLQIYDREPLSRRARLAISTRRGEPSVWRKPLPELLPLVQSWRKRDSDMTVVGPKGWPLAPQRNWLGNLGDDAPSNRNTRRWQTLLDQARRFWLNQFIPHNQQKIWPLPEQQPSRAQSRIPLEKFAPDHRRPTARWYRTRDARSALLVSLPLYQGRELRGFLLSSQDTDALLSLGNNALRGATVQVILIGALVMMVLILYAGWLVWRIRQLMQQTGALIDTGHKGPAFTPSRRPDELGDLSRHFHQLQQRVRNYTGYLETLGGKLAQELRAPLTALKSALELALANPAKNREYLQRALDGSERLRRILGALSEASRVETSIQQARFQPFDLRQLVDAMARAYADNGPEHAMLCHLPDEEARINGSPELLAQLLDKLVDNARDFAPHGTPIELGLSRFKQQWLLTVSNQGPILPPHLEGQLFDALVSHRDSEHSSGVPHLGLGLHVVRLIALAHDGKVEAHNRADGNGTIFTISLPEQAD